MMKKNVFLLKLLFATLTAFSQQDTTIVYVDENLNVVEKPKNAFLSYHSFQKDTANWIIQTFDKSNKLINVATYGDAGLLLLNGQSTAYTNGKPVLKGMYKQGNRSGNWITYDTLGHVIKVTNYLTGRLNGKHQEFQPNGTIREEGNYDWGIKKGEWKLYHNNGKVAAIEIFEGMDEQLTKGEYFDPYGNVTTREKVRTLAAFPGGKFYSYVSKRIVEMSTDMLHITGKLTCSFTVNKQGKVQDLKVISHSGNFFREAKMAILASPKWVPETLFGEIVNSNQTVTVNFVR